MMKKSHKEILDNLTIEQKAAQLTQLNAAIVYSATTAQPTGEVLHFGLTEQVRGSLGSVLNFGPKERKKIQEAVFAVGGEIPMLFMLDVVHGCGTIYPIPLAMGCSFDEALVEKCAEMSAKEALAAGIDVVFSPMVDLARDCRWGRVMETTGEDHFLNGEMGKAFIRGYHNGGIACCVKHFAAYGAAESGRDYNTTDLSDYSLHEFYYHSYRECLKENPELVMSSFNSLNGKPVNANYEILVETLRNRWGFHGVLVSDYNAVAEMIAHGYCADEKECAQVAINNQIDMEMMSPTYVRHFSSLVNEGKVSQEAIDQSVERVLQLKEDLGLFEHPFGKFNPEEYDKLVLSEEHLQIAQKAAEESFVLLKNEGVLPLNKQDSIALVGPMADLNSILGGWAGYGDVSKTQTVKASLQEYLEREFPYAQGCDYSLFADDESGFEEAIVAASNAKIVIVCFGEHSRYSGECTSRANPCVPAVQAKLIHKLKELNKIIVGVMFSGRPLILTDVIDELDALLCVWQPGSAGAKAITRTLYGENNPSGKLTMSFPRSVGQCPIYYNEFHGGKRKKVDVMDFTEYESRYLDELNSPLFPFGYGLSYTRFKCSDIGVSKNVMRKGEKISVSVLLKNEGEYDGEEVVQLYIHDLISSLARPIKELKGYRRIHLKAGEEKRVAFEIDEKLLSYHNEKGNEIIENGEFEIMVGNSSEELLKIKINFQE